ncbi:DUF2156 domain-containing protein, partial [bacterium]|nr:DUF2156 domain-containing protein [bacterium]
VGFKVVHKYVKVVGGLISAKADRKRLLTALLSFVRENGYSLSMFNICDDQLQLYRELGFQVNKIGEDALVKLQDCTWSGKKFEWIRRQSNYVRRAEVVISELTADQSLDHCDKSLIAELREVSNLHLAGKPQRKEMGLFVGQFLPGFMRRRRVFVARTDNGTGRIDGFIICTPGQAGRQWAMEMYRQRPDAVRGVIPALMHHAMQQMKAEGVDTASLCLIPALRCDERVDGDRATTRWAMVLFNRLLSSVYDTQGLYHYKSRFRPQFVNRYVCCYPKASMGGSMAFLWALGILNVKPGHVFKNAIRHLRPSRWTIAKPVSGGGKAKAHRQQSEHRKAA